MKEFRYLIFFLLLFINEILMCQVKVESVDVYGMAGGLLYVNKEKKDIEFPSYGGGLRIRLDIKKPMLIGGEYRYHFNAVKESEIFKTMKNTKELMQDFQLKYSTIGLGFFLRNSELEVINKLKYRYGGGLGIEFHTVNPLNVTFQPHDPTIYGFSVEEVSINSKNHYNTGAYANVSFGLGYEFLLAGERIGINVDLSTYYSQFSIQSIYTSKKDNQSAIEVIEYSNSYKSIFSTVELGFRLNL